MSALLPCLDTEKTRDKEMPALSKKTVNKKGDGMAEIELDAKPSLMQKYNVSDAAIAEMSEMYLPLKVSGLDDKEGYEKVRAARLNVKTKRCEVEKKREELKHESLEYGRAVDAEAKRLTALLAPIEKHLTEQQDIIDKEKKRIGLSIRALLDDPWQDKVNKFKVGMLVEGTITRLTKFGAFARLEGDVEGLIHISEISENRIEHPKEALHEGDVVNLRVIRIDPEQRRIGLSLRKVDSAQFANLDMKSLTADLDKPEE